MSSNIAKRLRDLRESRGLSQKEIASTLGMSRAGYGHYELGSREVTRESLENLAKLYQVSTDFLLCRTNYPNDATFVDTADTVHIPILRDIYAGKDLFASSNVAGYKVIEAKEVEDDKQYCYIYVPNDAMARAGIQSGALAFVRVQDTCASNDVVVAVTSMGRAVIRRAVRSGDGFLLIPESDNQTYEPVMYDPASGTVSLIGKIMFTRWDL